MHDKLIQKLEILSDAAKYDASCASGSAGKRKAGKTDKTGIGSLTGGSGICHSFTPDGRCVSLLKILMTNYCIYDCHYCINRVSSNVQRARFTVKETVDLTLNFYKRNYIEGLFLSSGIVGSPDLTMESMVRIAKSLRIDHGFKGYIHLKTIPNASPELQAEAGLYAQIFAINVFVRLIFTPSSYLYIVLEKQQYQLYLNIISTIIMILSLAIGYLFKEVIISLVLMSFLSAALHVFMGCYMFKLIGIKFIEIIKPFIKVFPIVLLVILILFLSKIVFSFDNFILIIIACIIMISYMFYVVYTNKYLLGALKRAF